MALLLAIIVNTSIYMSLSYRPNNQAILFCSIKPGSFIKRGKNALWIYLNKLDRS